MMSPAHGGGVVQGKGLRVQQHEEPNITIIDNGYEV